MNVRSLGDKLARAVVAELSKSRPLSGEKTQKLKKFVQEEMVQAILGKIESLRSLKESKMKITKTQLKNIIAEELNRALNEVSEKERVISNLGTARRRALNTEDPERAKERENKALELIKQEKYEDMKKSVGYPSYEKYNPLLKALKKGEVKPEDLEEIPMLTDEDVEDAKKGMERKEKERRMAAAEREAARRSK